MITNPVDIWSADSGELPAEVGGTRLLRRHHHVLPAEGLGRPRGRTQRRHRRHRGTWTGKEHSFNQSLKQTVFVHALLSASDGYPIGGGNGQRGDSHLDEPEQEGDGAQDGRQALHCLQGTSSFLR